MLCMRRPSFDAILQRLLKMRSDLGGETPFIQVRAGLNATMVFGLHRRCTGDGDRHSTAQLLSGFA